MNKKGVVIGMILVLAGAYASAGPVLVRMAAPVLHQAAEERINGTLTWDELSVTPSFDFRFHRVLLKDRNDHDVFRAEDITAEWSLLPLIRSLLSSGQGLSAIERIGVKAPELSLVEEAPGTWNLYSLLKPVTTPSKELFQGMVALEDGKAVVRRYEGTSYEADHLESRLSWRRDGVIQGALSGLFSGASFEGEGLYKDDQNFQGRLSAAALPAGLASPFLPESAGDISIKGGAVTLEEGKVWKEDGLLSFRIRGRADGLAAKGAGWSLEDGAARFNVYDGAADITDVTGKVNGESLRGALSVAWKEGKPFFNGSAAVGNADLARLLPDESVKGRVSGEFHGMGSLDDPSVAGRLTVRDVNYSGLSVTAGNALVRWQHDRLYVPDAEADVLGGHMAGRGIWQRDGGVFSAELMGSGLSLDGAGLDGAKGRIGGYAALSGSTIDRSLSFGTASISGEGLSWNGNHAGRLLADVQYEGGLWNVNFLGSSLSGGGLSTDTLAGHIKGSGGNWEAESVTGRLGNGAFAVRGYLRDRYLDFAVEAGAVSLEDLSGAAGISMNGLLTLKGRIQGSMDAPEGEASFFIEKGHLQGMPFDVVSGRIRSDGAFVSAEDVLWKADGGVLKGKGRMELGGSRRVEAAVETERMRIESLAAAAGENVPATGWLSGRLDVSGTVIDPEIRGDFHSWDGSAMGHLFQSASARVERSGGTWHLRNGLVYLYSGAAHGNGTIDEDGTLHMDLELIDVNAGRLTGRKDVDGTVTMKGHLTGNIVNPVFDGAAESQALRFGAASVTNLSGEVHYENRILVLQKGRFRQGEGRFTWYGGINLDTERLGGTLGFEKWNLSDVIRLTGAPIHEMEGAVSGTLMLRGTMGNPDLTAAFRIDEGRLADQAVKGGKADLSYRDHNLTIRTLYLPVGEGVLAAKGYVYKDHGIDMTAAVRNLNISWMPKVLGREDIHVDGVMTAGVFLKGTVEDPEADISIGIDKPQYGDLSFDSVSFMGNIKDNALDINQALLQKGEYKASMKGTVPVSAFTRTDSANAVPFNADINLDHADLNALVLFLKPVTSASGPIQGHVHVDGTWKDPHMKGHISVANGMVTVNGLDEPVTGIKGTVDFKGEEAALSGFAGIGGGLSLDGHAAWENGSLTSYGSEAVLADGTIQSALYKGHAQGRLSLSEKEGRPLLSGAVSIHDAVFDVPYDMAGGGESFPLALDVSAAVGDNVRLYNPLLYDMAVKGAVHAGGTLEEPDMSGKVEALRGQIKYLSNVFTVEKAEAAWGGFRGSFLPVLHVLASAKVGHYDVGMELDGPPGDFQFRLHSEPRLSDQQIMLLLTLRQDPNGGDSNVEGALFNAGLQLAFSGGLENTLRDTFGLDLINITSSLTDYYDSTAAASDQDFYYIKIGKYLFRDFMMTATTGVNNDQKSLGFHYDLGSRFGISAWYNSEHDRYTGAEWKYTF